MKNESENKMTRYQDDFYDAINGEWQKTAEIPADKSQTGGFVDLDQEIEDLMLATTDKWLAGLTAKAYKSIRIKARMSFSLNNKCSTKYLHCNNTDVI
mgnify:CR=1 FL=1